MLRLDADRPVRFCDGLQRRDFLHVGALTALGVSLPGLYARRAAAAEAKKSKDKSCIFLMLVGAPSQQDTWDPKPNAPREIRGPFKPIATNVPCVQVSEIFPRTAKHADKLAIVRSVYYSGLAVHGAGHQVMQTGRLLQAGIEYPHFGSVLAFMKGPRGDVPANVMLPRLIGDTGGGLPHGQTGGFLGKVHDPFVLNADPSAPDFKVPDLLPPDYLSITRTERRKNMRPLVDGAVKAFEASGEARLMDASFHQAYALISSSKAREAFDLGKEPDRVRERYGKHRFGASCLLSRRLIEAGVRFVTVNMFDTVFNETTWDIHGSAPFSPISCYQETLGPMFDQAYSALLEDLSARGLLDDTMVVATGEFGRTPKINPAGGRDHWPQCWSLLLAGGGIKGGQVLGSSDEIGGSPKDRPVAAAEIGATVLAGLGVDTDALLPGPQGRPIKVVDHGVEPIGELL
jgi:hypothetical protein